MGIKGIYNEIGPGQRIALSRLAIETLEQQGRPLRLAIDISIWLFQIQSGKGGTNPALRTFYYRLLRLISLSIHPLFVFDGPNKPPFKRGKRTGPNVASIPEFLAKQLLKQFAIPFCIAPGEAEAECALLQQEGIVDAVLSEDVDTLMFGSGLTMRNWSPEGTLKTRTFTHVNLYEAKKTKEGAGLDREGMILVALMSGGDYIPEGVPGCGPKTACEAARAGFGKDLCALSRSDTAGIEAWKSRLIHELQTNENKYFRQKHKALVIPDDFPRLDVLRYYTHPCISSATKLESLRESLKWDQDIDFDGLRTFVADAFDWVCFSGAKKFIRNLAPALLAKELRLRAGDTNPESDDTYDVATREAQLIKTIHLARQHISTDNTIELRVGYVPIALVPLDLEAEEPDPELPLDEESDGEEVGLGLDLDTTDGVLKKRGPLLWDPTVLEKIWIPETLIRLGVPLKLQDWEESQRNVRKQTVMKAMTKRTEKAYKTKGGMPAGALDRFTKITKPGLTAPELPLKEPTSYEDARLLNRSSQPPPSLSQLAVPVATKERPSSAEPSNKRRFQIPPPLPPTPPRSKAVHVIDMVSSPETTGAKRKRILRRSQSDTSSLIKDPPRLGEQLVNAMNVLHNTSNHAENQDLDAIPELPSSITVRRHRSPLRRSQSIPSATGTGLSQTTLLDSKKPLFRNPPALTMSPSLPPVIQAESTTAPKSSTTSRPSKPPSTPKKSKAHEVITISSSPAVTPKSHQRSIEQYLSPSRRKPAESPSRLQSQHPPLLLSQQPQRQPPQPSFFSSCTTHQISQSATRTNPPSFRLPLGATNSTSLNLPRTSSSTSSNSSSSNNCSTSKPSTLNTATDDSTTSQQPPPLHTQTNTVRKAEFIKLRESLDGAWTVVATSSLPPPSSAMMDGLSATAQASAAAQVSTADASDAGKKRKRILNTGSVRQWRLSQIGIVDLT